MRSEVQIFPDPPGSDDGRQSAEDRADLSGAVAQLGEHLLCKQGVGGSIPLSSTKYRSEGDTAESDPRTFFVLCSQSPVSWSNGSTRIELPTI